MISSAKNRLIRTNRINWINRILERALRIVYSKLLPFSNKNEFQLDGIYLEADFFNLSSAFIKEIFLTLVAPYNFRNKNQENITK